LYPGVKKNEEEQLEQKNRHISLNITKKQVDRKKISRTMQLK